MIREIVMIDEERCDGCGQCVPACEEGALQIIDGKARLVSDRTCDGMGACLGHCPQDAIRIVRREAEAFDEQAVAAGRAAEPAVESVPSGCPGSRFMQFRPADLPAPCAAERCGGNETASPAQSELRHWPVQLRLLSPQAPVLRGASLLVAADCIPVACADFHRIMLRGRAVVVACPKLDDPAGYVEKLAEMIRANELLEIVVAHMEVPCCVGLLMMVLQARQLSGRNVPVSEIIVSTQGEILRQRRLPADAA
ncbi:MAG: 4Fe-4S binding protein [Phycisphaerales bacterium]|nr:MAG: 4Fe-4S binding protein [Phycisphaerales bacterium]